MGTTSNGFPYPEPTDPIAAGADAIKALAQAVDLKRSAVVANHTVAQLVGPDAAWVNVAYPEIVVNTGSSFNGTIWTAPAAGKVRVSASAMVGIGNSAPPAIDGIGDYQTSLQVLRGGSSGHLATFFGRFGAITLKGAFVFNAVNAGETFTVQVYIAGAAGKNKSVGIAAGSLQIEYL